MKRSVIFDLDGTLLDRDKSIQQFIAVQYDRLVGVASLKEHRHLRHIPKLEYTNRFIELDCHGHVWKDKVYQILVDEFKIDGISWQELLHDYETQFQFHCVGFPGLTQMLDLLKQQGYLLGIISNGRGAFQMSAIVGLGIQAYFDTILISETEGIRKPQPEIFHSALDRLDVFAQNSTFVGDNPEADILGAKNAGMSAIWKRNAHWQEPTAADASINALSELPPILDRF